MEEGEGMMKKAKRKKKRNVFNVLLALVEEEERTNNLPAFPPPPSCSRKRPVCVVLSYLQYLQNQIMKTGAHRINEERGKVLK